MTTLILIKATQFLDFDQDVFPSCKFTNYLNADKIYPSQVVASLTKGSSSTNNNNNISNSRSSASSHQSALYRTFDFLDVSLNSAVSAFGDGEDDEDDEDDYIGQDEENDPTAHQYPPRPRLNAFDEDVGPNRVETNSNELKFLRQDLDGFYSSNNKNSGKTNLLSPCFFVLTFLSYSFRNCFAPRACSTHLFIQDDDRKSGSRSPNVRNEFADFEFCLLATAPTFVYVRELSLILSGTIHPSSINLSVSCPLLQRFRISCFKSCASRRATCTILQKQFHFIMHHLPQQCIEYFDLGLPQRVWKSDLMPSGDDSNSSIFLTPLMVELFKQSSSSLKRLRFSSSLGEKRRQPYNNYGGSSSSTTATTLRASTVATETFRQLIRLGITGDKIESLQFAKDKFSLSQHDREFFQVLFGGQSGLFPNLRDLTLRFTPGQYFHQGGRGLNEADLKDIIFSTASSASSSEIISKNPKRSRRGFENIRLINPPTMNSLLSPSILQHLLQNNVLQSLVIDCKQGYSPTTVIPEESLKTIFSSQAIWFVRKLVLAFNNRKFFPPSVFRISSTRQSSASSPTNDDNNVSSSSTSWLEILHLSIEPFNDFHLQAIAESFPNLRRVHIQNSDPSFDELNGNTNDEDEDADADDDDTNQKDATMTTSFHIRGPGLEFLGFHCHDLQVLELSNFFPPAVTAAALAPLPQQHQRLSIDNMTKSPFSCFGSDYCYFAHLRFLALEYFAVDDNVMEFICSGCSNLEVFTLSSNSSSVSFAVIGANNNNQQPNTITDRSAVALGTSLSRHTLRVLDLGPTAFTDAAVISHLCKLTNLELLNLNSSTSVGWSGFAAILKEMPQLRYLGAASSGFDLQNLNDDDENGSEETATSAAAGQSSVGFGANSAHLFEKRFWKICLDATGERNLLPLLEYVEFPFIAYWHFAGKSLANRLRAAMREREREK